MAVKSVIEIDVLDESFKSFADAFEKYQKALKAMPADWQKVNSEANKGTQNLNKELQKAVKSQKDLNKFVGDSSLNFRNAANLTGTIAKNLASSAVSVAKWLAFGAIGGGFGLGALASSASNVRRQALGAGVTTGQLRASRVALSRYIDPDTVLGNIANIQADLSRRQILTRLGAQQDQNPAQMLEQVMRTSVQEFKKGGKTSDYAQTQGLLEIFSIEDLRRMSANEKEFNKVMIKLREDAEQLEVPDDIGEKWQDFTTALSKSGNLIEKSLITNLVALVPEFEKLSTAVAKTIDNFLSSDEVKLGIQNFANYLKTPEFKDDVTAFMKGVADLAKAIGWIVSVIPDSIKNLRTAGTKIFGGLEEPQKVTAVGGTAPNKIAATLMELGVKNPEAIAGFMGGTYGESSFNPKASNLEGGGHYGLFQLGKTRQKEAEAAFGKTYWGADEDYQIANFKRELQTTEKATLQKLISAKSKQEGAEASLGFYRPFTESHTEADRTKELNRRLSYANQIRVEVSSTAGSDITASAKGLPK